VVVFNTILGKVFSGKIERVIKVSSHAQLTASSTLPTMTGAPVNDRWGIRVTLDNEQQAKDLLQGQQALWLYIPAKAKRCTLSVKLH
jgi:multidrug resistance efflux pump